MKESPLGLLIPEVGDPPLGPQQIGGNAERGDALHQSGGLADSIFVKETNRASASFGSFGTPIKVQVPRLLPFQVVEILCSGHVAEGVGIPELRLFTTGKESAASMASAAGGGYVSFMLAGAHPGFIKETGVSPAAAAAIAEARESELTGIDTSLAAAGTLSGAVFKNGKTERKPFVVELQGKQSSAAGFIIEGVFLAVHVFGG